MAKVENSTQLQELYVAYFGRAADPAGRDYWINAGTTQAALAANLHAKPEWDDAYGDKSVEVQINHMYQNLFDREADTDGLQYWTNQVNDGHLELDEIATHLIWAAKNNAGSEDDKTCLENKAAAAVAYTVEVEKTTAGIVAYQPTTADPWVAGDNITEAKTYLSTIDKDTAHTDATITASVDKILAVGDVTGESVSFTTGNEDLTGTAANDTYSSQMDATAALNTQGVLDKVNGGEGTDTLIVVNTTANAASTQVSSANITNIEVFDYRSTAAGNLDLDTAGSATTFKITQSAGAVDITDVNLADDVSFINTGATMDTTMTWRTTEDDTSTDADTVTLSGLGAGGDLELAGDIETITLTTEGDASSLADLVLDAQTTTLNIDAASNLTVTTTFTNAGVKDVTVTGAGNLDFDDAAGAALGAAVTKYDASASTGDQDIIVGATNTTVTTGDGDDTVDMQGNLNKSDTIDLGDGTDVLRVDLNGLSAGATDLAISNVETLRLDSTENANGAMQMDNLAFTTVRLDAHATNHTGTLTLTDLAKTTTTFQMKGAKTADANLAFNALTVDYDTTTTQSNATIEINNAGDAVDADDIDVGKFDIDRIETLTITATDIGTATSDELTIDEIEADHMTDLVITADGELILTTIDGAVLDTLDLSGADSGITATISDCATSVTATLGDGNDTFTQSDTAGALTIDLGAGNDTITGASAAIDNITTGTGNDTIISNDFDYTDVINDFSVGSDTYQFDLSVFETADEVGSHSATLELEDGNSAAITLANYLTHEEVASAEELAAADQLIVMVGADFTNAQAEIALELGGNRAITTDVTLADNDAMLVLYSDGTDWTLAAMHNTSGATTTKAIAAGETDLVDLVTFADLGTLDTGDYDSTMIELIA